MPKKGMFRSTEHGRKIMMRRMHNATVRRYVAQRRSGQCRAVRFPLARSAPTESCALFVRERALRSAVDCTYSLDFFAFFCVFFGSAAAASLDAADSFRIFCGVSASACSSPAARFDFFLRGVCGRCMLPSAS